MTPRRLLELWEPPQGHRLASVVATTYELQADFLEEELLPVALDLRIPPARGRDFRLELERALQDTEVSVFFHPGRYQAGLRRSPRIDLVPLPEGRYPKLHAKVALLRFVSSSTPEPESQVVRLVVGSANLTSPGYRSNIELGAAIDDAPGAGPEAATAVRDAMSWLAELIGNTTDQVKGQLRDLHAVFRARPAQRRSERLRFVALPSKTGFPALAESGHNVSRVTMASPFWPVGDDLSDVASALRRLCGGSWRTVRLIGPADRDENGEARPVIPARLVRSLREAGASVEVAAADPAFGCAANGDDDDDDGEFDDLADRDRTKADGQRSLHAKALLVEGDATTSLAIGSFNLTRKGMGLVSGGNAEAGLIWSLPKRDAARLTAVLSFGTAWREVTRAPEEFVVEPATIDSDDGGKWPDFIISLRARRDELRLEGDAGTWPAGVVIRMRDIRSRLQNREEWFDAWAVQPPAESDGLFLASCPLRASWRDQHSESERDPWPPLPDLEAEVSWGDHSAVLPVLFEDKHLFPVVESRSREDEQSLIAWFLGLRPIGETEDAGFGHSIDPVRGAAGTPSLTGDILSYLVRDFVHALPGIRSRLAEAGMTETGLRAALLGHRSPVELARETLRARHAHQPGRPRKTAVATVFQLAEIHHLLQTVPLPELAEGATDALRTHAVAEVGSLLAEAVAELPADECTATVGAYLAMQRSTP